MPASAGPEQEAEFSALFRQMHPELRSYGLRRLAPDLVDDVVAETFLVIWRRWADLPTDHSGRRAWVYGVVRNKMLQATDRTNRDRRLAGKAAGMREAEATVGEFEAELGSLGEARRLLDLLPPAERDAVSLTVIAGLSCSETALVLGCSVSSVTTRVARARQRLRRILTEHGREIHEH